MSRAAIWITSAAVLLILCIGAAAYVLHQVQNAPVPVDTREMLGHPARTAEQRARALDALALLERDANGPLQRYRTVALAHTLSAYGSIGGWSARGTVKPFTAEIAAFEAELWTRLARDLDATRVGELKSDGFELDAFPFGRVPYEFSISELGAKDRWALEITGPAGERRANGPLVMDDALASIVRK